MVRAGFWKEQLIKAAGRMNKHRQKGNKSRVVLNGANTIMGRAKRGIYEGCHIQFGNKVSEDGGNKSRRNWKPNVRLKRLYSVALDKFVRTRVTTRAIRCIDKAGGLDEYLVNKPDHKMENDVCLYWKRQIQTVNRFLFKLQCGNIPPELHSQVLKEYTATLATKRGLTAAKPKPEPEKEGGNKEDKTEEEADEEAGEKNAEAGGEPVKKPMLTLQSVKANQAGGGGTLIYKKCPSKHKYSKDPGFLEEWHKNPRPPKFYRNSIR